MQENGKSTYIRLTIVSLMILLVGSFWFSVRENMHPISIVTMPAVPREGEPVLVTFKLNNSLPQAVLTSYQFYANGELLTEGDTAIPPVSCETHQYAYENRLQIGKQLNFVIKSRSEQGNYEKVVSLPSYSPQIWTSFVSFASFSTSLMSSMSTMTYYQTNFGTNLGLNIGIIVSIVLIALLVFLELHATQIQSKTVTVLGRLRMRLSTVTWILFVTFVSMFFAKIAMIISG